MKLVRYEYLGQEGYGVYKEENIYPIEGEVFGKFEVTSKALKREKVILLNPVNPGKIIAIGLNYADHAGEFDFKLPEEPLIFMVSNTSVIGPEDKITITSPGRRVDFEGELVVIIGKECFGVKEEEALDYVLGYTCGNDVSDRYIQKKDGQWTRAKSYPTYKPMGPWIETELNPDNLSIETLVNGEVKQSSNTKHMIFSVAQLVSFVSQFMPLYPGDAIYTGTPEGVGRLDHGDWVEVKIEGIGTLKNQVERP